MSFKPYYKWITFNTEECKFITPYLGSFKPYYKWITFNTWSFIYASRNRKNSVLNLIINGLPSIQNLGGSKYGKKSRSFKPYYKWITFNTKLAIFPANSFKVLNLIINGLPSIPDRNKIEIIDIEF